MSDNNNGEARFIQKWNAWYWVERNDKHILYYGPYPTREVSQRIKCGYSQHAPLRTSLRPTPAVTRAALLCAVALIAVLPISAEAQQSRSFYDQRGSFAGSAVTRGNSTSVYDGRGSFADRRHHVLLR
jgi:hypothetical protein